MSLGTGESDKLFGMQVDLKKAVSSFHTSCYLYEREWAYGFQNGKTFEEKVSAANMVAIGWPAEPIGNREPHQRMFELEKALKTLATSFPNDTITEDDLIALNVKLPKTDERPEWTTPKKRVQWIAEERVSRLKLRAPLTAICTQMQQLVDVWTKVTAFKYTLTPGKMGALKNDSLLDPHLLQIPHTLTEMRLLLPQC